MIYQTFTREGSPKTTLQTFVMDSIPKMLGGEIRPAVVVCPGGGYKHLSPREGENLAVWLNANGFHAFVVNYTVREDDSQPPLGDGPLLDVSWAVSLVRAHAQEWNVDPNRIAVLGCSAGAHAAASLGVFWNRPDLPQNLGIPQGSNQPNALVLCYPVLVAGEFSHLGSFQMLCGDRLEDQMKMSLEAFIGEQTPPCFLWHTMEDKSVPVENSLIFASALRRHNIPFELHIFEKGGHGLSTCQADVASSPAGILPETGKWMGLCLTFLRRQFKML